MPGGQGPWYPPPGPPPAGYPPPSASGLPLPIPPRSAQGRRRVAAGITVLVAGVAASIGLALGGAVQLLRAIDDFARAPAGCTTVLEFDEAGTYSVFVETRGEMPELSGTCPWRGSFEFEGDPQTLPIRVVDPSAGEVPVEAGSSFEIDTPWRTATSVGTLSVDQPGEYRLTAGWTGSPAVVAVGRWPWAAVAAWLAAAAAVGIGSVVTGVLLVVSGRRRSRPR